MNKREIQPLGEIGVGKFTTYSGALVSVLEPKIESIRLEDIAHALSMQCRFAGHVKQFYSVAQHSVLCWWLHYKDHRDESLAHIEFLRALFMHDAHEAYVQDIISPLKKQIGDKYATIEDISQLTVCSKYHINVGEMRDALTKKYDYFALELEYNFHQEIDPMPFVKTMENMSKYLAKERPHLQGAGITEFLCWTPTQAKASFLCVANMLQIQD